MRMVYLEIRGGGGGSQECLGKEKINVKNEKLCFCKCYRNNCRFSQACLQTFSKYFF
jgi:hypothetical protein